MAGVEVIGLKRLIKRMSADRLIKPMRRFLERSSISIESAAKENAPVDTGRLRASITHEIIEEGALPRYAKIGVLKSPFSTPHGKKAFAMEYGTGLLAEGAGASGKPHYPPAGALGRWAGRHGFASGAQVSRIIGKRGGLRPRRYMRDALKAKRAEIGKFAQVMAKEIADGT